MRILITDGDNRSALAATRSLGLAGHEVHVASPVIPGLSTVSKHCRTARVCPNPAVDPDGFVSAIVGMVEDLRIELLMPMTEITTLLLTQHRDRLIAECRLPFPAFESVAAAANKARVLEIAAALGVPIPRTRVIEGLADALACAAQLQYPVVLKPARSRIWNGERWISTSVSYAENSAELTSRLRSAPPEIFPVLAQERIEGPGVGVFLCVDEHGLVASFAHRRINEKPPSGGQSVLCESAEVEPIALEQAVSLLRELRWQGVAMVEFKRDLRDGSLRLMEINGRFWGSLQLAIDAGVDFPVLLADLSQGKRPTRPPPYQLGVRSRWLWGGIDALLAVMIRSRKSLKLPPGHPGRLRYLLRFLAFWQPGLKYEIERMGDIGPALLETRRRLLNQSP